MKQDFNDPVDSLLRDYARRVGARESSVRANQMPEPMAIEHHNMEHPDADEMAAFAENALPAAARARTVAHLADCDGCRQLVSALTHAENTASESAKSVPPQIMHSRPSWREKLAGFFASPTVLRYAVPSLAAFIFVALIAGIMFNRRQPDATLIASKQEAQTTVARTDSASSDTANATNSNATASSANPMAESTSMNNTATRATTATTATTTTTTATTTTANTAMPTPRADYANNSIRAKEAPATSASQNNNSSVNAPLGADITQQPAISERQNFGDDALRTLKRDRTAAAPPSASNANANMSGNVFGNNAGVAATQSEQVIVTSDQVAKAAKGSAGSNGNAAPTSDASSFSIEARAAGRRRAPSTTTTAKNSSPINGRAVNNADASAAPSRRVNGRDFRRQGTRWIDAAYVSSQSTTNIARGSKQYRTVVSAEPGIGKIAAQLDGEIVVVWKGRAYRIR